MSILLQMSSFNFETILKNLGLGIRRTEFKFCNLTAWPWASHLTFLQGCNFLFCEMVLIVLDCNSPDRLVFLVEDTEKFEMSVKVKVNAWVGLKSKAQVDENWKQKDTPLQAPSPWKSRTRGWLLCVFQFYLSVSSADPCLFAFPSLNSGLLWEVTLHGHPFCQRSPGLFP